MRIEFFDREMLSQKDIESLWAEGVDMDDWDYVILAPLNTVSTVTREVHDYYADSYAGRTTTAIEVVQNNYQLSRMLVGCCSNTWYIATFRGRKYAIGVAYHS